MGQTATSRAEAKNTPSARRSYDSKILLLFAALAVLSVAIPAGMVLFDEGTTPFELATAALGTLSVSFLIVGIPIYLRYRKNGLTPRRKIFRRIAMLSAALTAVAMVATVLGSIYAPDVVVFDRLSVPELILFGAFMAVTLFATFMLNCYTALVAAFGIVGIMTAVERVMIPWVLGQVARLSGAKSPSLLGRGVRWLFDIPDVLDTRTLAINPTEPRTRVSLSDLRAPVLWQLAFGLVLGIYISFNPFVADRSPEALMSMFSLLAIASTLFPFLILPWFIFSRLGASIGGQTKPFALYNGIRSRVFRSYTAVGTIVIIVRLSFQEIAVAFETYIVGFAAFMGAVLVSALLSTFVYLDYFENDLSEDVVDGLEDTDVQVVRRQLTPPEEG